MKYLFLRFLFFLVALSFFDVLSGTTKFILSSCSEEYNTRYFYCRDTPIPMRSNGVFIIDVDFPNSFVVELAPLLEGQKTVLVNNGYKKLKIERKRGNYIMKNIITRIEDDESKISLYFVENRLIVYIGDNQVHEFELDLNRDKKIGIQCSKKRNNICRFLYCYEPVPFTISNYGDGLEKMIDSKKISPRMSFQNVGEPYSVTSSSVIRKNSLSSTRFEYQYKDSKAANKSTTQRARSEILGVYSHSPMNKWIIEYDLFIPEETVDDSKNFDIITQIHEGSSKSTTPAFYLALFDGNAKCNIRGDFTKIEDWEVGKNPVYINSYNLIYLKKNMWHHIKIYLKESYQPELKPVTRIWIDGILRIDVNDPNCYNFNPRKPNDYNYFKFGIYKPGWLTQSSCSNNLSKRVYYFDNIVVKN